jgi:hypothetical protein
MSLELEKRRNDKYEAAYMDSVLLGQLALSDAVCMTGAVRR